VLEVIYLCLSGYNLGEEVLKIEQLGIAERREYRHGNMWVNFEYIFYK